MTPTTKTLGTNFVVLVSDEHAWVVYEIEAANEEAARRSAVMFWGSEDAKTLHADAPMPVDMAAARYGAGGFHGSSIVIDGASPFWTGPAEDDAVASPATDA